MVGLAVPLPGLQTEQAVKPSARAAGREIAKELFK